MKRVKHLEIGKKFVFLILCAYAVIQSISALLADYVFFEG